MQLSVIIINYNVKYFLEQCILSVIKAMKNIEGEIIVVDNNSTDDSEHFLKSCFRDVHFIWNKKNVGFAKANNQAIEMAQGDYLLILNPDTILPEDCLGECIRFIQSHDDNCALGIRMIDGSGKFLKESKRAFPTPWISFCKLSGLSSLFPKSKVFSQYHLGYLDPFQNHEVDVLAGAFMMIPRKIMNVVKGFDEIFFMYGEDVDLSYRIQKAGFKNYYFSETPIIHFKGESTKKGSLNYVKMFYSAMSLFVKKHYGGKRAGWFNFFIQLAIALRAGMAAMSRFIKWIGLPVIDIIVILFSLFIAKEGFEKYLHYPLAYNTKVFAIAFSAFTFLFMAASYFSGLYDVGYKQSKLNRSAIIGTVVVLVMYALLPRSLRVSKTMLCIAAMSSFILLTLVRFFLVKWKIIARADQRHEMQTFVAGNKTEFNKVISLLKSSGRKNNIYQRISLQDEEGSLLPEAGKLLTVNLKLFPEKEIVFCEGKLSFKQIIEMLSALKPNLPVHFFSRGSHTLIESNDKNEAGEIIVHEEDYQLSLPMYKRAKATLDFSIALFFLLTFPVHLFTQKKPVRFFAEVFDVLFFRKTWIGYATNGSQLPPLKPGVITVTGLPENKNQLSQGHLANLDKLYAKRYSSNNDLRILWAHYPDLS